MQLRQSQNQQLLSSSSFQAIHQKRINQLQQKVNLYCSQYDALMKLLSISHNFPLLTSFQQQIDFFDSKLQKLKQINQKDETSNFPVIDKKYWQKQLQQIKNILENNQKEIKKLQYQVQHLDEVFQAERKKKQSQLKQFTIEQKIKERVNNYQEFVYQSLAQHKNEIQINKHEFQNKYKQILTNQNIEANKLNSQININKKQNHKSIQKQLEIKIQQIIQQQLSPFHKEIYQLQQQIQISKLKIPPITNIKKFHQFNYNRLTYQINCLNQDLQQIFLLIAQQNQHLHKGKQQKQVKKLQDSITDIKYQIKGLKKRYQIDFLINLQLQESTNNIKNLQNLQIQIHKDIMQLEKLFKQLQFKYFELIKYFQQ